MSVVLALAQFSPARRPPPHQLGSSPPVGMGRGRTFIEIGEVAGVHKRWDFCFLQELSRVGSRRAFKLEGGHAAFVCPAVRGRSLGIAVHRRAGDERLRLRAAEGAVCKSILWAPGAGRPRTGI